MNVSLYQAAAAMNAQTRWQEMITENLAAGTVPGFRKQEISFADVAAASPVQMDGATPASFLIPVANTSTSFQQGELRPSGQSTDFAIDGPGFFEIQLPNGDKAYTRDGEFQLNAKGQLTTKQGCPVLGNSGPIQFDPNNASPLTVSATGQITQAGESKGQLRLVTFANPNSLTATADGCLIPNQPGATPTPVDSKTTSVHQGFLEAPNTSPTVEMGSLINAMRIFEANQKVLQTQDDRMGRAITDLSGTT
jgi:flagellar basal body rod protein FlgG